MGTSLKGVNVKGIRISGSEFLEPTQITNCVCWLKWQTSIVSTSGKLTTWNDQIAGNPAAGVWGQTAGRIPSYNVTTGAIKGDGVDDLFYRENTNATNTANQEWWFVLGPSNVGAPDWTFFSWMRNDGADGDALIFGEYNFGILGMTVAVGTGAPVRTVSQFPNTVPQATFKYVVSVAAGPPNLQSVFYNGVECAYTTKWGFPLIATAGASRRQYFIAQGTNGLSGINCGSMPFYEFAHFTRRLTTLERTKLCNYFKQKHLIL